MRHYQRGIATSIILTIFLIAGVAVASGYFIFFQKQQKTASVNSFEDCAKLYPVMESYPSQCNTPDGKHFIQQLSDEEKQKLVPPESSESSQISCRFNSECPNSYSCQGKGLKPCREGEINCPAVGGICVAN